MRSNPLSYASTELYEKTVSLVIHNIIINIDYFS